MALLRNILLFHQGALGDFILTWPIAIALARIHPQSRLFYVTHAAKGKLAERLLGVESIDAETGWHSLFGDGEELGERQARMLAGSHSIIGFLSATQKSWVGNVRRHAPQAEVLTIDPTPPDGFAGHAVEFQLEQLRPWLAAHAAAEQILRSIQARGVSAARPAETAGIVIHPGSGSPRKNWRIENYVELIGRLRKGGHDVRVLIGEVERERWSPDVIAKLGPLKQPATCLDLMAELLPACAFIGNDSGPGHLAAILGVPTLALFGPKNPSTWRPLGPSVITLRGEPLETLKVEAVEEAVKSLLQMEPNIRPARQPDAGED
jgi:heptosyltransferase-3